ncbi:MAG: tetratricopeptide repeat protein [Candidatus Eiseniibacteriota bacterium]
MTSGDRWAAIEAILDELLELAPGERSVRLVQLAAGDEELRAEIEALLAEDQGENGPLDRRLDSVAAALLDDTDTPSQEGRLIGPYRVVRELGRGGMGEVLLAERADGQFEQQVALKIVRGGLNREDILRRFRHERTILARLRHPNIALLHDGGIAADGVPYFAMEYVQGEPITDYCDRRTLGIPERIALFESVCRAVQYAHRNLVIHRDLKPSNVLVTADGVPKLLDFGIAKVINPGVDDPTQATRGFLTPAYAAPEQIRGEPTSTATDVFSLGVLLYVLLAGHHPHGDTSSSVTVARAIVEEDPVEPSTVAGRSSDAARLRRADPAELRRALRGDLDNIVAKALRKNADDRYASVDDLRTDLERHRGSLPVSARPATARYRMHKFVRRHRVGVAAAAAAALALAAGVAGIAWQANVAARERDRARAVKDYLLEVFSGADPAIESGETLTALELVERGAARVSDRFAHSPGIRAEVMQTLGAVLTSLGRYERGDSLLSTALVELRHEGREEAVVETLHRLGGNARARGDFDLAAARYEEAVRIAREAFGERDSLAASALGELGMVLTDQAKYDEAEAVLGEALAAARAGRHRRLPHHLSNLANLEQKRGRLEAAEALYRESIELHRASAPHGDVATARAMSELASVLLQLGRVSEGESLNREALAMLRREYGEAGHPEVATALNNLAGAVLMSRRWAEAEPLLLEALAMHRRFLDDSGAISSTLSNLAVARGEQGDLEGAERYIGEAIESIRRALGDRHPELVIPLLNRGSVLRNLRRFDEAEPVLQEALAIARETLGEHHRDTCTAMLHLAALYRDSKRLEDSERAYREAASAYRGALGEGHPEEIDARIEWARIVAKLRRTRESQQMLDRTIADARAGGAEARFVLSRALLERAMVGGDDVLVSEAYEIRRAELGEQHPMTVAARSELERRGGL